MSLCTIGLFDTQEQG